MRKLSKNGGLHINRQKTEIMSPIEDTIISIDSNQLENVKEYIYLGQKIQLKKINKDAEIEQRILLI